MTTRNDLLGAARRATEVIADFHLKDRIKDGYTRIDPALLASMAEVIVIGISTNNQASEASRQNEECPVSLR